MLLLSEIIVELVIAGVKAGVPCVKDTLKAIQRRCIEFENKLGDLEATISDLQRIKNTTGQEMSAELEVQLTETKQSINKCCSIVRCNCCRRYGYLKELVEMMDSLRSKLIEELTRMYKEKKRLEEKISELEGNKQEGNAYDGILNVVPELEGRIGEANQLIDKWRSTAWYNWGKRCWYLKRLFERECSLCSDLIKKLGPMYEEKKRLEEKISELEGNKQEGNAYDGILNVVPGLKNIVQYIHLWICSFSLDFENA